MSAVVLQMVFDVLPWPIWVVDGSSKLLAMNRHAKELLAARTPVRLDGERLWPGEPAAARAWNAALAPGPQRACLPTTVPLGRFVSSCHFAFVPLDAQPGDVDGRWLVALVGKGDSHDELQLVQRAFGLTRSEVRLLEQLVSGRTLKQACTALAVSDATARTQLRALFAKTSTRRQAELVLLTQQFPRMRPPAAAPMAAAA